jgi:hypothetical protein
MAQYISMQPAERDNVADREERVRPWWEPDHPHRHAFPLGPRESEKKNGHTAKLTPLGEKFLGLSLG